MLNPDPIWIDKQESCSSEDEESSESEQSEEWSDSQAADANSFDPQAAAAEEEKVPELNVQPTSPVHNGSISH